MSIQEVSAEQFARVFYRYHEALAPDGDDTDISRGEPWQALPVGERNRLIAAVRLALLDVAAANEGSGDRQRYFAKPGEAEWGC
jgi:hypothetical protein